MAQLGWNMGKETVQGIVGGLIIIAICVGIGSVVAQAMSHGPEQKPAVPEAVSDTPQEEAAEEDTADIKAIHNPEPGEVLNKPEAEAVDETEEAEEVEE